MQCFTACITIARPWRAVVEFLDEPRHYPRWAPWLGPVLQRRDGEWLLKRADGSVAKVRFSERNGFGIADHWVLDGEDRATLVALRVLPSGDGSEVLLSGFREAGTNEAQWAAQQAALHAGLRRLQEALQPPARRSPRAAGERQPLLA